MIPFFAQDLGSDYIRRRVGIGASEFLRRTVSSHYSFAATATAARN
jgi:hypothetical protein